MKESLNFLKCLILFSMLVFSCQNASQKQTTEKEIYRPEIEEKQQQTSTQMLFAVADDLDATTGKLFGMTYQNKSWRVTFDTISCSVGRNGFAPVDQKIEGDGQSPSGVFPIGAAFGYKANVPTDLRFIELTDNHFWVSDTASNLYNQLIEYNPKDDFSEKMRRNDHLYKYGIVIEYNTEDIQKGAGSAIFLHIHRKEGSPTAGCVAVSEENIKRLLAWLKPFMNPLIVMGSGEFCEEVLAKSKSKLE